MNPTPSKSAADRLADEAAFHDQAFEQHVRSSAWKFYGVANTAYERYAELLLSSVSAGCRALEYGCGPGSRAFMLAAVGAHVDGIDISPVAIELARKTAERNGTEDRTSFTVMDAEHLEFPAESFDLVCGTSIIHHLDVERAYGEVARVLKPGGTAVFLEALGHNPAINLYRRLTPALRTEDEHPLRMTDVEAATEYFARVETDHFALLSLTALVAHGRPGSRASRGACSRPTRLYSGLLPFPWVGERSLHRGSGGHRPLSESMARAIRASGL